MTKSTAVLVLTAGLCLTSGAQEPPSPRPHPPVSGASPCDPPAPFDRASPTGLPSPWVLSARLDGLQLTFADEVNKPLEDQSFDRLCAMERDTMALAREVAFAVNTADSMTLMRYIDVANGLRPVRARITAYVSEFKERQEVHLQQQRRSEEARRARAAAERAWQERRVIEEPREKERAREAAARARQVRIAAFEAKGWPADVVAMILDREVRIGMTADQVREAWGSPAQINTTTTRQGQSEQWVYGVGQYLYFDNGVLTAIQQSRAPSP